MALFLDVENQPTVNITGEDAASQRSNTELHTVHLLGDIENRATPDAGATRAQLGFEAWRQLVAEIASKTTNRRLARLHAALQHGMGDYPAKLVGTIKCDPRETGRREP